MSSFSYQKWNRQESEQRIINNLSDGDKSFGELLEATDLSRPVLSKRLKSLERQKKVQVVPQKEKKRFLYHLSSEALSEIEKAHVLLHKLSQQTISHMKAFAKDKSLPDEEYANRLVQGVQFLFNFKMYERLLTPRPVQNEWVKATLGIEFARSMPELFLEDRSVLPYIFNDLSPREQDAFTSEDMREAANRLIEYLKPLLEKLSINV